MPSPAQHHASSPWLWGLLLYCEACICLRAFLSVRLREWSHAHASFGTWLLRVMSSRFIQVAVHRCSFLQKTVLLMVS